ncbi:MAG TPA: VOC family protein [Solirubrobacteraceae bacterium]|jgi:glyoxalase family protein|nr:VOC family protein [Solirubrobacteraceae bacterium]
MQPIEGIHHISLITGDAPANVDFYARVLGLRLVKKTVNQDDPSVYHLFYADEHGSPGADITFFEYPGARRGRAGAGMVTSIVHRVGSEEALDFWQERLSAEGVAVQRLPGRLRFADPEGMAHELAVIQTEDRPLTAAHTEVPQPFALQGFEAIRAAVADPARSEALLSGVLGFTERSTGDWEARGARRGGRIIFERRAERGLPGAGTVHHVAWSVLAREIERWQAHVTQAGARATPVIDRFYFQSVYFREPGGILYELATIDGAGFAADEDPDALGLALALPPFLESRRAQIEPRLTPLPDTRAWRPAPPAVPSPAGAVPAATGSSS